MPPPPALRLQPVHDHLEDVLVVALRDEVMDRAFEQPGKPAVFHPVFLVEVKPGAIFALAKTGYLAHSDLGKAQRPGDLQHTEGVLLIDANCQIRGIYNGLSTAAMFDLIADIKLLKTELATKAS
jgi:hypothetical protein